MESRPQPGGVVGPGVEAGVADLAASLRCAFFPYGGPSRREVFSHLWCEVDEPSHRDDLWSWLKRVCGADAHLLFERPHGPAVRPSELAPRLAAATVPGFSYLSLHPLPSTGATVDSRFVCRSVIRHPLPAESTGLSVVVLEMADMLALWDHLLDGGETRPDFYLTSVGSTEGLAATTAFLARRAPQRRLALTPSFFAQPMQVTDACQFALRLCPVAAGARPTHARVDLEGTVRLCHAGPGVGLCGTPLPVLESSFRRIFRGLGGERCCRGCGRGPGCSCCPDLPCSLLSDDLERAGVLDLLELVAYREEVEGLLERVDGEPLELLLPGTERMEIGEARKLPRSALVLTAAGRSYATDGAGGLFELTAGPPAG